MLGARPLVVGGGSEAARHCIRPISLKSQVAPPGSPWVVFLLLPWVLWMRSHFSRRDNSETWTKSEGSRAVSSSSPAFVWVRGPSVW